MEDQVVFDRDVDQDCLLKVIPFGFKVISPNTGRTLSKAALGGAPKVTYDVDW